MLIGVLIGTATALLDAFLLWYGVRKAAEQRERASAIVMSVFAARYLLLAAVLAVVLIAGKGSVNAVGVILPMIVQKIVLTVLSLFPKR